MPEDLHLTDFQKLCTLEHASLPLVWQMVLSKNIKVADWVRQWVQDIGGEVNRAGFRKRMLQMGFAEEDGPALDDLFDRLDEDGGGTLDVEELKAALGKLRDATAQVST